MKEIKITDRICNLYHKDLDGISCNILLSNVFKKITSISTNFNDINKYLITLDYSKYDWIFITDLHPKDVEYLNNPKIILLDHHSSALEFHNPSKNRYVVCSICGAKLVKRFLERYFKINLSKFNNLIYLTNDYDLWIHNNKKSKMLNELFFKYWDDKFRERFFDGSTRFIKEEILWLRKRIKEFKEVYNNLEIYNFPNVNGCMIITENFSNDCCEKLLKEEEYNIVLSMNPKNKHVSVRHNILNFHMGNFLKMLDLGGGHAQAAAFNDDNFNTTEKNIKKFIKNINEIIIFKEN